MGYYHSPQKKWSGGPSNVEMSFQRKSENIWIKCQSEMDCPALLKSLHTNTVKNPEELEDENREYLPGQVN